jgi:hypothetical protein
VTFEAVVLVEQLGQLGRDLEAEVTKLGQLEEYCVDTECDYRGLVNDYDDQIDEGFLATDGSVEAKKAYARLKAAPARGIKEDGYREWQHAKARVRVQQASIQALHRRIEIGRSMLSREKSLMELDRTLPK